VFEHLKSIYTST